MDKNYINKLLDISTDQISDNIFPYNNDNEVMRKLLRKKNGFFAFVGALHIFSYDEYKKIADILKKNALYDKECFYFGEDIFGNLFCEKNGKYYLLDIETGSYEFISDDLEAWAKTILDNYNYYTGYQLAYEWQKKNRKLKDNERLIPKIFFVLGGDFKIDNLYPMDRLDALNLRLDFYNKLKNLSDNDKIIIET